MKKQYYIPAYLIDKGNVSIDFDYESHSLSIEFSDAIKKELSKWPRHRANDLKDDVVNAVEYWFLHEPMNSYTIAQVYDTVFTTLHQTY